MTKDKRIHNPLMPGLRVRHDGWTAERTRRFLEVLGYSGCVRDAGRVAGISGSSVDRSRALFPAFDAACREALARAGRGLEAIAYQRAVEGRETIIIRKGEEYERRITPSDAMLRLLIQRGDLSEALGRAMTPEQAAAFVLPEAVRHRFVSAEEFAAGMMFERGAKVKRHIATQEETDAVLIKRIAMVEKQGIRGVVAKGVCPKCEQALSEEIKTRWLAEFGFDRAGDLMVAGPG